MILEYYKELIKSYSDTKFTIKTDRTHYIKNMVLSDNFKYFLNYNREIKNFYFITPYNPCSINFPKYVNTIMYYTLKFILIFHNTFKCRAKHMDYPYENGFIILNSSKTFIFFLQLIFGQIAVIEYKKDKQCKFIINYFMFLINYMKHCILNFRIFTK